MWQSWPTHQKKEQRRMKLAFNGREEKTMDTKIQFVKAKDVAELSCSSEERAEVNEGGNTLPPHPSSGKLQKVR
jgi:hypothetical protein